MLATLTTDFGAGSPYIAELKGVLLTRAPLSQLIDITHDIPPQNIAAGALVLAQATPWFPPQTLHIAVVDPGVGTSRKMIYARIGEQRYLAPDNGLLSRLAKNTTPSEIYAIENHRFMLPQVSRTFHGRDILAPVAAALLNGLDPSELGSPLATLVQLNWPEPQHGERSVRGEVLTIDHYGNMITNIRRDDLPAAALALPETIICECVGQTIRGLQQTYGNAPPGQLIALVGSGGYLELAIVNGNAARQLRMAAGDPVTASW